MVFLSPVIAGYNARPLKTRYDVVHVWPNFVKELLLSDAVLWVLFLLYSTDFYVGMQSFIYLVIDT